MTTHQSDMDMRRMEVAIKTMRSTTEDISLSAEEEAWLARDEETQQSLKLLASVERALMKDQVPMPDLDLEFNHVLASSATLSHSVEPVSEFRTYFIGGLIGAVAMLAVVIGISIYKNQTPEQQMLNQVTESAGASDVTSLTTADGETLTLNMADGTTIVLNNNSRLDYPRYFEGSTRTVHLEGEALFKVRKDRHRPFVVLTKAMTTTVHGTTFNVKAYPSQPTSVALVEGSVEVKLVDNSVSQFIKPGQRAEVSERGMMVSQVNTDEETAWSEGQFYYDNRRLEDVAYALGQWYHLSVVFKDSALKDLRLNFAIQKRQPASETIDMLNSLNRFKVTLEHNQIIIEP